MVRIYREKMLLLRYVMWAAVLLALIYPALAAQDPEEVSYEVEALYDGSLVTSIVWAADGRMFFTEKEGDVRLVRADGTVQPQPVVRTNVRTTNEDGLQSIVLAPDFLETGHFYVFYTEAPVGGLESNVIVRYTDIDGVGSDPREMMRISSENGLHQHNGGRMRYGPDGFLYVSIGDMQQYFQVQDLSRPEAKIHRFVVVGDNLFAAPDNPISGNSMWAYGLRNVFAFAFDPLTGRMFATDNGPQCDDEINLIISGQNYGWGLARDYNTDTYCTVLDRSFGVYQPLISFSPTIAPTGIMIYDGDAFPQWYGHLFFCSFLRSQLLRIEFNEARTAFTGEPVVVPTDPQPGCAVDLQQGPDGFIYYSGLSGIYRIVPLVE